MRFLPREEKFFGYFLDQIQLIIKASDLMARAAREGNSSLKAAGAEIDQLERQGDKIIHEVYRRLSETFITPLDPEDLHSLASRNDDVLDGIEDVAHRIVSYHIDPIPAAAVEICFRLSDCSKQLDLAFRALDKGKGVLEPCIEINRIEEEVDAVYRRAVQELFETEQDPIQLIKLKEIYDLLEETIDRCEDVADALQNVVVKNS